MREYNCTETERKDGYIEKHEALRTRVIDCTDLARVHKDCFRRPMDTENTVISVTPVTRMLVTE